MSLEEGLSMPVWKWWTGPEKTMTGNCNTLKWKMTDLHCCNSWSV